MQSNVLFINEYFGGASPTGKLAQDLHDHLTANKKMVGYFSLSGPYLPGGLRFRRLVNFLYFHIVTPVVVVNFSLFKKNRSIIVLTSPPLIHWTVLLFAKLCRTPVIVWYMDAHPELEIRAFFTNFFGRFLKLLDRLILSQAAGFIVLDNAARTLIVEKCYKPIPIAVAPPWATYKNPSQPIKLQFKENNPIKFIYAGNFGQAHSLDYFCECLESTSSDRSREIVVTFAGMLEPAITKVIKRLNNAGIATKYVGRFAKIEELYAELRSNDFGIVSLTKTMQGIVVPSKAFTYLSQGLPIFYDGPKTTLADELCEKAWGLRCEIEAFLALDRGQIPAELVSRIGTIFPNPRTESLQEITQFLDRS